MGQKVADLYAELMLNDSSYKKGMQNAENQSKKTTGSIKNDIFSIQNASTVAWGVISTVAIKTLTDIAKESLKVASSMTELDNVLTVTFGNNRFNAIAINADAMGKAMGRSSLQMRQMVSQFGALNRGANISGDKLEEMSMQVAKLAVDMGSFWNTSDSMAQTALESIWTAETESLKKYGIVMTEINLKNFAMEQGITKLYKDMNEAERVQLRYNFVLAKTAFLQGDAERTIKSTANQMKVFKSNVTNLYGEIGKNLNPSFNDFLQNLNEAIESISENEELIDNLTELIVGLGYALVFTGKVLKQALDYFVKFVTLGYVDTFGESLSNIANGFKQFKGFFEDVGYWALGIEKPLENTATGIENITNGIKDSFKDLINSSRQTKASIGQDLYDTLSFYVKFTQGMSTEVKKQISVTAALGSARSILEKGGSTKEAQKVASQTYDLTFKTLGLDTGNQNTLLEDIRKSGDFKLFKDTDWVNNINNNKTGGDDKTLTLDKLQKQYDAEIKAFNEYSKQRELTEEEKLQGLLSIQDSYSKQAIDNKWIEYGKTLSLEANQTQSKLDSMEKEKKALDELNKSYDEAPEKIQQRLDSDKEYYKQQEAMQTDVFKTLSSATNQQDLKNGFEELYGKYSDQGKIIEYLNSIYPNFLNNLEKQKYTSKDLVKDMNDVADLTGELAKLFDDDLLGAMSNVLNGISSGIASYASGNILGTITSAVGVLGTVSSALDWTKNVNAEAQNEANEKFAEAVEKFKKSVDDMTLGQQISFSKLQKPVNLSSGSLSSGGINQNLLTAVPDILSSILGGGSVSWGADNASVDTLQLQKLLNSSGYGGIDTQAIMNKYAQREDYIDASDWFKKKSRIVGYDTAGAMAEIQKLIDEAYAKNMENIKKALGFTHTEFANNMASVFKSGGDIATSLNDMFSNALITAFFNQEAFEILNKQIGNAMSEAVLGEMKNMGIDMNLTGTFEEQMAKYAEITGASFDILNYIMKKYGITVGKTTEQMQSLENTMPTGTKLALAGFNAISTTVNQGQTIVYQVENNYSKDFQEMVDSAQNQGRYRQTGNMRGRGY